jgi:two-component system, LytTR family, sensor kinase
MGGRRADISLTKHRTTSMKPRATPPKSAIGSPSPPPKRARHTPAGAVAVAIRLWGLAFACLIPLLLIALVSLWIGRQHTVQPFRPVEAVGVLIGWSIWAALAPLIVGFVWLVPLNSGRWARGLSVHLIISCLLVLAVMALFIATVKLAGGYQEITFTEAYWRLVASWYPYLLIVYWVIAVAAHAVWESRRAQDREVEASRLREQLTAAQLSALQMQLHPHFLCNTLNTAAVFLRDGQVEQACEIVTGLGSLLHTALDRMDDQEVTLQDELTFVGQYLELERIRFSDRMRVTVRAASDTNAALVPCMILQPIVENAIRHGISQDLRAGRVSIGARLQDGRVHLTVQDDGPGLRGGIASLDGHGVGLYNTRARLLCLYGTNARLEVRDAGEGGVVVEISLPFHTGAARGTSGETNA